jgi:NAD(P)-dependent dehydrogenase (short-subunit alcohol dehydrogenase family)
MATAHSMTSSTQEDRLASKGVTVLSAALDVCDSEAQTRAFSQHMAKFGRMDVAVLNAGIGEKGVRGGSLVAGGSCLLAAPSRHCILLVNH